MTSLNQRIVSLENGGSDISQAQLDTKQDVLIAGDNITITDSIISSTGGSSINRVIGFRAETIGNTGVTIAAGEKIPFNSKNGLFLFDTENAYNTSTYEYTITVSGFWTFHVSLFVSGDPTLNQRRLELAVVRNSIRYAPCVTGQYSAHSNNINVSIPLLIGDVVSVNSAFNSLNIFKSDDNCWFNGHYLGAI